MARCSYSAAGLKSTQGAPQGAQALLRSAGEPILVKDGLVRWSPIAAVNSAERSAIYISRGVTFDVVSSGVFITLKSKFRPQAYA